MSILVELNNLKKELETYKLKYKNMETELQQKINSLQLQLDVESSKNKQGEVGGNNYDYGSFDTSSHVSDLLLGNKINENDTNNNRVLDDDDDGDCEDLCTSMFCFWNNNVWFPDNKNTSNNNKKKKSRSLFNKYRNGCNNNNNQ